MSKLSKSEELLLMQYYDNEINSKCGLISAFGRKTYLQFRVNRLLSTKNTEAISYLDSLRLLPESLNQITLNDSKTLEKEDVPWGDLWSNGIKQRILAEERAAIFLGPRAPSVKERTFLGLPISTANDFGINRSYLLASGMMGVAFALGIFSSRIPLTSFNIFTEKNPLQKSQVATEKVISPRVLPVQLSSGIKSTPKGLSRSDDAIMEIDWLRSDGTAQVFQNEKHRSTLIWVKRKRAAVDARVRE